MIVKMKKYSFLIYHQEYADFLEDLRNEGMVHINVKGEGLLENEELNENVHRLNRINHALKGLEKYVSEEAAASVSELSGEKALEKYESLVKALDSDEHQLLHLEKEIAQLAPWGHFSPESIKKLEEEGYAINFFSCSARKFNPSWEEDFHAFEISQVGSTINFITVTRAGEPFEIDADPVRLPEQSLSELEVQLEEVKEHQKRTQEELIRFTGSEMKALQDYKVEVTNDHEFGKVKFSADKHADDRVIYLEGWIPVNREKELLAFLDKSGIYYENAELSMKEKVPVMLKNNKFNKLFELIGELYSMPEYGEIDLTPYFAPFYWLFFGFCLGDAGYGLLLAFGGMLMQKRVKPELRNALKLVMYLGFSTIIFGVISGTFFGMDFYEMKLGFYGDLADRFAAQGKTIKDHLFTLSLLLGAIQIVFGMFIKAANEARQFGWKYAVGTAGWLTLIVGGLIVYLLSYVGADANLVNALKWLVIIAGFLGAFLFNNPERNVFANFGAGIWDAYNMVTGILGDLLSYIRLFALGISSGILGYVFNSLAMEMSPDIPGLNILIMVIILLFGHGINIFMAALGSFVHPMRLTFVEFYKNSGFTGGGVKYSPFKKLEK